MSGVTSVLPEQERPRRAAGLPAQSVIVVALLVALTAWLAMLGRPLVCACGSVRFFVAQATSPENSQQFADFYSGLHIVFGFGLWVFLDWMKPHWSTGQKLLVAVASSVAWESVENIPLVITLFGHAPGSPGYAGDTILNALGDTLFVAIGFFIASALPLAGVVALALAIELGVSLAIDDGLLLGALRLLGVRI